MVFAVEQQGELFPDFRSGSRDCVSHRKGSFQLAIEVHFVARKAIEPVGIDGLAESLRTDQGPAVKLSPTILIPG
jgi:hypothetical protein